MPGPSKPGVYASMTEDLHKHRSHRHRQPSRLRLFLRRYWFEIVWLAVVALGIFLIFERMNIRQSLFRWLSRAVQALLRGVGRFGDTAVRWLSAFTLSDAIGLVLILGALVAIALRTRWRLLHTPALSALTCPKCNGAIHRVHRTRLDHLIGLYVPVRRYRCANRECKWQGLRVHTTHGAAKRPSQPARNTAG